MIRNYSGKLLLENKIAGSRIFEGNYGRNLATQSSSGYCMELVRKNDHENFLCTLLAPSNRIRSSSFAVRAFNVEIARIANVVSDDKIGIMRLRFWTDALVKIFDPNGKGPVPDHPVIRELKMAIAEHQLPKIYLNRLIKSRERSANKSFITTSEMEQYAEESVSSIYYLLLKLNNIENVDADHAASHLGKSQGIINMLRSIPHQNRRHALPVPQEILLKNGISQERFIRLKEDDKAVQDCVFELASLANNHIVKARSLLKTVPKHGRHIYLPTLAVDRYLERLRRSNFNLLHDSVMKRDNMLPVIYYINFIRKKY